MCLTPPRHSADEPRLTRSSKTFVYTTAEPITDYGMPRREPCSGGLLEAFVVFYNYENVAEKSPEARLADARSHSV